MYQTLKNLTATQQIGALFVIVFGLLMTAGVVVFLLSMRESEEEPVAQRRRGDIKNLSKLLRISWMMIFVFWVAWISGDVARLVLFGLGSFFAPVSYTHLIWPPRGLAWRGPSQPPGCLISPGRRWPSPYCRELS